MIRLEVFSTHLLAESTSSLCELYKKNQAVCAQLYGRIHNPNAPVVNRVFCAVAWVPFKLSECVAYLFYKLVSSIPIFLRQLHSSQLIQMCESLEEKTRYLTVICQSSGLLVKTLKEMRDDSSGTIAKFSSVCKLRKNNALDLCKPLDDFSSCDHLERLQKLEPRETFTNYKGLLERVETYQTKLWALKQAYVEEKESFSKVEKECESSLKKLEFIRAETQLKVEKCREIMNSLKGHLRSV